MTREKPCNASLKRSSAVKVDPEIRSGTPCVVGTRVPARTLIAQIVGGDYLDGFLDDFLTVVRKQAVAFLEEAGKRMLVPASMHILFDGCIPNHRRRACWLGRRREWS